MLTVAVHTFGSDVLEGASQISLLVVSAVCVLIGITVHKAHWLEFEKAIRHNISNTATAIIVLLVIGALSSAWMISGVVPLLIYYGTMISVAEGANSIWFAITRSFVISVMPSFVARHLLMA